MVPPGTQVRPTTDKVREATFNALWSMGAIEGATVVDLFAGTGALGIEALSRGARHATFVERNREALSALGENLERCGFTDRATVRRGDALAVVDLLDHADLLFCDPPYDFEGWDDLLPRIQAGLVVIESPREVALPPGWTSRRNKRYRSTVVQMATPAPASGRAR